MFVLTRLYLDFYAFITAYFLHLASSTLQHVYLDGTDEVTDQVWKLHTGEPLPYINFHPQEGSDAATKCAAFVPSRNFKWGDVPCTYPKKFICEIDLY